MGLASGQFAFGLGSDIHLTDDLLECECAIEKERARREVDDSRSASPAKSGGDAADISGASDSEEDEPRFVIASQYGGTVGRDDPGHRHAGLIPCPPVKEEAEEGEICGVQPSFADRDLRAGGRQQASSPCRFAQLGPPRPLDYRGLQGN